MKSHRYEACVTWSADDGVGTKTYRSYSRDHVIEAGAKPPIEGSSDPAFRGNASRYNPEELLVASASACHMLWYLHLCAVNGITVLEYRDDATGVLEHDAAGSGRFAEIALRPVVILAAEDDAEKANALHARAHESCFIARSLNFPITIEGRAGAGSR